MIRKRIQIINKLGLHARAAAKMIQTATKFSSHIEISREAKVVNGKSIMGLMMLAASKNTWIDLTVAGKDELQALQSLENLVNNRFGEKK